MISLAASAMDAVMGPVHAEATWLAQASRQTNSSPDSRESLVRSISLKDAAAKSACVREDFISRATVL
jgi:hypothetical protein